MTRISVLKNMIRLGMRFVPNQLGAYRFCAAQGRWLIQAPPGFQMTECLVDGMPGLWLGHVDKCQPRVVLYLHGGGYAIGSNRTHVELACRIAEAAEAQVFMLEYRLAPENPYPAALDDAVHAYRYLLANGVRAEQIVVAGDSAGGGLTFATVMRLKALGIALPAAVVGLSPWLDLSCSLSAVSPRQPHDPLMTHQRIRHFAELYSGRHAATEPGISPLFGDPEGLPPTLIQVGGDEILVCEARAFQELAQAAGVALELQEWPGMFHVWHFAARLLPEGARAIAAIGDFVRRSVPVYQRDGSGKALFRAA